MLLHQYKAGGDLNVLGELYNRYMDHVYGVCLKYFKEPAEAQDAVIHIFEELTTKLRKYEVANFKGWLYQVARNHCLMEIRSRKSQPVVVEMDIMYLSENAHPDIEIEKEVLLDGMEKCLEQLPGQQKEAIRLFYLEGKCYKEIAEITKMEFGQVRSYIQNGRRNLKICMEKQAAENA